MLLDIVCSMRKICLCFEHFFFWNTITDIKVVIKCLKNGYCAFLGIYMIDYLIII